MHIQRLIIPALVVIGLGIMLYIGLIFDVLRPTPIRDFESCLAYGFTKVVNGVRECEGRNGDVFRDSIQNKNVVEIDTPRQNTLVVSPLTIQGRAKGIWFFEGSFPIDLVSKKGVPIASGVAQALGDSMVEGFVPFTAHIDFSVATTTPGLIVFKKDNPSGKSSLDASTSIEVTFTPGGIQTTSSNGILTE
jgi:hypothetical protein